MKGSCKRYDNFADFARVFREFVHHWRPRGCVRGVSYLCAEQERRRRQEDILMSSLDFGRRMQPTRLLMPAFELGFGRDHDWDDFFGGAMEAYSS